MTNTQHLNNILSEIAQLTGEATDQASAKAKGHERYLFLDHNAQFGGYRLVNVGVNNGAHYWAFGFSDVSDRLKYSVMLIRLEGILAGLNCLNTIIHNKENA